MATDLRAAVEPDEFGAAERSGEPDQQQCLIAQVDGAVAHALKHCEQIVALQRPRLALGSSLGPPYALHRGSDDLGSAGIIEA